MLVDGAPDAFTFKLGGTEYAPCEPFAIRARVSVRPGIDAW